MASHKESHKPPFEKVLIIGAGPSGLILALLLAQQNIPSTILEAWPHLDTRLRATQYGVPATRVFKKIPGLLADFRTASIPKFPAISWRRVADGEKLMEIDMSVVEDEEDRMVVLPLGTMVQILWEHVERKFGENGTEGKGLIDVRFNHKVLTTGQDEKEAWVDIEISPPPEEFPQPGKRTERLSAPYLIGCDGASSTVRHSLFGKSWPGQTWPCRFIVQNVYYSGFATHAWDGGNYMVSPEHWGLIAKRGKTEQGDLWRVTYGDNEPNLTDEEYLARRDWHFKHMLPGNPEPHEYVIEQTNLYNIHNRCAETFKVGRILLAADAAHVCNPMGGYGCMTACLDVDGLADCLIGHHQGKADSSILQTYSDIRREIFLKYVDARSVKNLDRVRKSDPWTVRDADKFFGVLKDVTSDRQKLKDFLLKISSIEYDFTQHYHKDVKSNGMANGATTNGAEIIT